MLISNQEWFLKIVIALRFFSMWLHVLGYVFFNPYQDKIIIYYILENLFLNLRVVFSVAMVYEFLATYLRVLKYLFFHLGLYKVTSGACVFKTCPKVRCYGWSCKYCKYWKNRTINGFCVKKRIEIIYWFPFKKIFTSFYHTICDFSKKIILRKSQKLDRRYFRNEI